MKPKIRKRSKTISEKLILPDGVFELIKEMAIRKIESNIKMASVLMGKQ